MSQKHWYFSQYQTPNIIIVPTEEPLCKKAKLDVSGKESLQNTENSQQPSLTNLTTIPTAAETSRLCSSSINKSECPSKLAKTSWATNFLQSIGQVHEKPLSKTKKAILFEDITEKTDSTEGSKSTANTIKTPSVTQRPNKDEDITTCLHVPVLPNTENVKEENLKPLENENIISKSANEKNKDAMKKDRAKDVNKNESVSLTSASKLHKNKTDDKSSKPANTFIERDSKRYPDKRHSEVKSSHSRSSYYADKFSNSSENRRKPEIKAKHLDSHNSDKTGPKIRSTSSSKRNSPYKKTYDSHKTKHTVHKIVSRSITNIKEKIKYYDNKRGDHKDNVKFETNNKNIDKTVNNSSKYESVKQNENKIVSPIRSVVQIPDKYKSSSAASPCHRFHKSIDLRNKLWRKNDKSDNIRKNDDNYHDKYKSTQKDNLIISINNTNDNKLEIKTKDDEQTIKEINFVINIIFEQRNEGKDSSKEDHHRRPNEQQPNINNNVDLSFLDDFNIDEIVESLKDTQNDSINLNNDLLKGNEKNKSNFITKSSKEAGHNLKDYSFRSQSDSIKYENHDTTDIISTISNTNISKSHVKKDIVKQEVKNISEEEQKVIIVYDDDHSFKPKESKNLYLYPTETTGLMYNQKQTIKCKSEDLAEQQSLNSPLLSTTDDVQMSEEEQDIFLTQNTVKNKHKSNDHLDKKHITEDIITIKKNVSPESVKKEIDKQEDKIFTEEKQKTIIEHDNNIYEFIKTKNTPLVTTENNIFTQEQITECKNIHTSTSPCLLVTRESANPQNIMTPYMSSTVINNVKPSTQKQAVVCENMSPTISTKIIDVDSITSDTIFIKEPANHEGLMTPCNIISATAENNIETSTEKQYKNNYASIPKDSLIDDTPAKQQNLTTRFLAVINNVEKRIIQKVQEPNDQLDKNTTETIDLTINHTIDLTIDENDSNRNTSSENNKSVSFTDELNTSFCQENTIQIECEESINCDSKQRLDINENQIENEANGVAVPKCRTAYVCEVGSNNSIDDDRYKNTISNEFDPKVAKDNSKNTIDKETGVESDVKTSLYVDSNPDFDDNESKTTRMKITEQCTLPDNKTTSIDGAITVVKTDILMNKSENKVLNKSENKVLNKSENKVLNKSENKALNKSENKALSKSENKSLIKSPLSTIVTKADMIMARELEECVPDALRTRMPHKVTFILRGKFSKIFISENIKGQKYAIKVLHPTNDQTVDLQKTNLLTELQRTIPGHRYKCIDIIKSFYMQGFFCLIMECFPWNLQQALKAKSKSFHVDVVQNLTAQLVTAVMTLNNNNIVHLDIKPNHILLNVSCNKLKLCGFDSARYINCPISVLPNVGMVSYRAPEVIMGYKINYKVDVWNTGLVIYEMATNSKLFSGVYNNDILFKQMCMFGNIPYIMIASSVYGSKHFLGTSFRRVIGTNGQRMSLITLFNNTGKWIGTPIHQAFVRYWNMGTLRQKIENKEKLNSLIDLLERMLVLFPDNRFPIEFVSAHPFVYEAYQN